MGVRDLSHVFRSKGTPAATPAATATSIPAATTPATTTSTTPSTPTSWVAPPAATPEQLINKAATGTPTPNEPSQPNQMHETPAMGSTFTAEQRKDLQKFVDGKGPPPRAASELHSDFRLMSSAKELPGRFAADLLLANHALLEHAGLLRADKATRLFEFAVPYVQAMVQMAGSPAELRSLSAQLLAQAEKAGFKALVREPDGKNGLEVLSRLLKAGNAEDVARLASGLKFDAPGWPKDPVPQTDAHRSADQEHLQAVAGAKAGELMRPLPPVMQPPMATVRRPADEISRSRENDTTPKKLGPMMLWNVLHRLREAGEEGQESAAQREQMTQLALVAGLILVFFAIVIGVLVAL